MTADAFAELLGARRVGSARWMARCPAHNDRHPSLSVRQGSKGILLRCWSAGCTPTQIVAALGLAMGCLFDAPLTQATRIELELSRAKAKREAAKKRRRRLALLAAYRACTRRMDEIVALVFNSEPEGPDELGLEFLSCIEFQRQVEESAQ